MLNAKPPMQAGENGKRLSLSLPFCIFFKETRYKIFDNNHQIALGRGDRGRDAWLFTLYRAINPNQHYYFNILLLFLMLLLPPHLFLNSTSPPSKNVPPEAMTNVDNTSTITTVVTTVLSVNTLINICLRLYLW